jgi:hypothetical protein
LAPRSRPASAATAPARKRPPRRPDDVAGGRATPRWSGGDGAGPPAEQRGARRSAASPAAAGVSHSDQHQPGQPGPQRADWCPAPWATGRSRSPARWQCAGCAQHEAHGGALRCGWPDGIDPRRGCAGLSGRVIVLVGRVHGWIITGPCRPVVRAAGGRGSRRGLRFSGGLALMDAEPLHPVLAGRNRGGYHPLGGVGHPCRMESFSINPYESTVYFDAASGFSGGTDHAIW